MKKAKLPAELHICRHGLHGVAIRDTGGPPVADWPRAGLGALVDPLNPKAAIFFPAFLPQFVEADAGPVRLQPMVHGLSIIVGAAIVEVPLVLAADRPSRSLRTSRRVARTLDRALGAMFIGLGSRPAVVSR